MNRKEQWMFLEKIGRLIEASLSLGEAIRIASKNIRGKKLKKEVLRIQIEIADGKSLAEILSSRNDIWKSTTVALIGVGEVTGTLYTNLLRASNSLKMQSEQRSKILSSLFYPAIISVLAVCIIIFLLAFVYPKIIPLFVGMKAALPLSTRIMISISRFISKYWLWIVCTVFSLIFSVWYLIFKFKKVRLITEVFVNRLPIIGKVILLNQLSEISFIIGSLCSGGTMLFDAIDIGCESLLFTTLRLKFVDICVDVRSGAPLSECILKQKIFPDIWNDLVLVGEKTGTLPISLLNISDLHRQEVEETMTFINKLIEPLMMIAVGVVVGFIAMSIVTPMYSITQQVHV